MIPLKIAVIGVPGKWSTEVLADALTQRTGYRLVVDMRDVSADLDSRRLWARDVDLSALDGIIVKKISSQYSPHSLDRLELLRLAEGRGVRVFSRPEVMMRMMDRLGCTMTLQGGHVPMPPTTVTESCEEAVQAIRTYGAAVLKPLYSSKAQGMVLVDENLSAGAIAQTVAAFRAGNPMMYIQKKLNLPGQDLGMVFLGGEYLGSYARVSQGGTWNTTVRSGGRYAPGAPPRATIDLATRAQALFGLDFTTVDVAESDAGPVVFEVSAFGGFRGAKEGLGVDAAALYADYALKELVQ